MNNIPQKEKEENSANKLLNTLIKDQDQKPILQQPIWLIEAKGITKSDLDGFKGASTLLHFSENSKLINQDFQGTGGFSFSNLEVLIPKDSISVDFLKKFYAKSVISSIDLIQVGMISKKLTEIQKITYSSCKIELFEVVQNISIKMGIRYNSKSDLFVTFDSSGKKKGNNVASSSSK